jgi:periplasmic protein TonB
MSDKYLEKTFLYLVLLSVLLHLAVYQLILLIPPPPQPPEKVTMVDLMNLPDAPPASPEPGRRALPLAKQPSLPRQPLLPQALQEAAPKAQNRIERIVPSQSAPSQQSKAEIPYPKRAPGSQDSPLPREESGKQPARGEGLFKPQRGKPDELAKLFPTTRHMERIEESVRKEYENAERGDTRLMDTDDPTIGTFTRRFVVAVRDRLNAIDRHERKGVGATVVNVRINRDGSIENTSIIYSTGNQKLEELAVKALRSSSYIGPLPRRWEHDVLNLICSFTIQEGGGVSAQWELVDR